MLQEKIHTVTEITREIKRVIGTSFTTVWIEGELSGYKRQTSGHHYFTLKDGGAQIPCCFWKMNNLRCDFKPEDGMKVQGWGSLEVYEPQGKYQFIVVTMRPVGKGDLQRAYEALKKKLHEEGLFDTDRKRELPRFPEHVGLVTSLTGAALQDMRTVAARRWPPAQLHIASVKVQGTGAGKEIAEAIEAFNRDNNMDVLVVGRGGGSIEDLWAFNEEVVARAIFNSKIPVVSAVGHEVDVTIADLVADVRAATPSAAMEIVLPDCREVQAFVRQLQRRMSARFLENMQYRKSRLSLLSQHWALRQPVNMVHMAAQRVDELHARLDSGFTQIAGEKRVALNRVEELLTLLRPQAMFARGYAMVKNAKGEIVRDVQALVPSEMVNITFARGTADAEIKTIIDQPA